MTMTTRDKLLSLLAQIPVAQSEYLHDGRTMTPPPMEAFADKIMTLFASPIPGVLVVGEDVSKVMTAALKELQIDPVRNMTIVPAAEYYQDTAAEMYGEFVRVSLELAWYEAHEEKAQREQTPDLFERVMTASAAYVTRFGGTPTEEGAIRKLDEEVFEFKFAITDSTPQFIASQDGKSAIAGELIDLLVTAGGLSSLAGLTWADIQQAARDTLAKLDARTEVTHAWNPDTKTVERIGKVTP